MGVTVFCRRRTLLTTVRGMVCQWDRWLTTTTVIWTIIIDCITAATIIDIIIATVKTISTSCWTAMKKNSIY